MHVCECVSVYIDNTAKKSQIFIFPSKIIQPKNTERKSYNEIKKDGKGAGDGTLVIKTPKRFPGCDNNIICSTNSKEVYDSDPTLN